MNKTKLLIIVLVLVVVSASIILIPTYDSTFEYVNSIATILSCFCALFTLILAISIYDKYGLSSKSHEEIMKTVIKLYECLRGLTIILNIKEWRQNTIGDSHSINCCYVYLRWKMNIPEIKKMRSSSLTLPCYFSSTYIDAFQNVAYYKHNLFIPDSIKKALMPFDFGFGNVLSDSELDKACVLISTNDIGKQEENIGYMFFNNEEITLETYLDNYLNLKQSIYDWLLKNGANKSILNIEL